MICYNCCDFLFCYDFLVLLRIFIFSIYLKDALNYNYKNYMFKKFYYVLQILVFFNFLFLNYVEVQQTLKFARSSATFCHTRSHPWRTFGAHGSSALVAPSATFSRIGTRLGKRSWWRLNLVTCLSPWWPPKVRFVFII